MNNKKSQRVKLLGIRICQVLALIMCFSLFISSGVQASITQTGDSSWNYDKVREEWAYAVGLQAYTWGYPLVSDYNRFDKASKCKEMTVINDTMPSAPINRVCFLTHHVLPEEKAIIAPNVDTLYGPGWLDLRQEPIVLRIPDMGDRYWIVEMCDFYTDVFASPGTRRGSKAGLYLVAGPNWKGNAPAEIVEIINAPTNRVVINVRVLMKSGLSDRPKVLPLINQIILAPLSQMSKMPKVVEYDKVRIVWVRYETPKWVPEDNTYWDILKKAIDTTEIRPYEEVLVATFKKVLLDASNDQAIQRGLDRALENGKNMVKEASKWNNLGSQYKYGWTLVKTGGRFGIDYLTRMAAAESCIGLNLLEDAAYYNQVYDSDSKLLNGSSRYTIHFDKGNLPPIDPRAFWSVTAYDDQYFLEKNKINRYNIGTVTKGLVYNSDGSLDIYLQHDKPEGKKSNWLPVPKGNFEIILRIYMPGPSITNEYDTYNPPPVVKVR
jgi:hypothetical protein